MPENLSSAMRSATENLHPNIGKLTTGGIERGVRKRRTRRVSQIAGAAASVTAVFGVVAMVGAPGHGGSADVSAAAGRQAAAAQSSTPGNASTEAAPGPGKPAAAPVSGPEMASWLQESLQSYHFTDEKVQAKAGTDDMAGPYATLQVTYPAGVGSVSVNIARSAWQDQHTSGSVPYVTTTTLKDGSHLMVFDGPEWPAGNGDPTAKRIDVSWYRNDGTLITVEALNESTEKGATTASVPGLTVDQATNVAESTVWDKAIASVLAKPAPTTKAVPGSDKANDLRQKTGSGSGGSGDASSPALPPAK